jgi:hypothetical protein
MKIEHLRKDLATKFVERSKIAWALYERDFASKASFVQFVPKYYKKDSEDIDFEADPLRNFKLDHKKLQDIIWGGSSSPRKL